MTGGQTATILILLCAVVLAFWALFQLLPAPTNPPVSTPAHFVLHTPTSTATGTSTMVTTWTGTPQSSSTPLPEETATGTSKPTLEPSEDPTATPLPPTKTPRPSPTATATPTPSPIPQPTAPPEVAEYLEDFVTVVVGVHNTGLPGSTVGVDQGTVDQLREAYRRLHAMTVPEAAGEMHLDFVVYVSVLEEECLCHIFAEAHLGDAQGQHFRQCETSARDTAAEIGSQRFVPSRDAFLEQYSLTAQDAGFPF